MWRWDQGRLSYFQFSVIQKIANVLFQFENIDITKCEDLFRKKLISETGMPFLPSSYTIKRNYSRVFQCSFLANFINNKLIITDICRSLNYKNGIINNADTYFFNIINKFRFPFPAFNNYNTTEPRSYPFHVILKFLLAKKYTNQTPCVSIDEIFSYLIGNNCTGFEDIKFYESLYPTSYIPTSDEKRQLRELIIFISQFSIFKMYNYTLYLDNFEYELNQNLLNKCIPQIRNARPDKIQEFMEMTSLNKELIQPSQNINIATNLDIQFIEGNKMRVEHLKIERSHLLRKYFKKLNPIPICDACKINMKLRYPWTDYMLEVHHLLPLSSSLGISTRGTSLQDLVGLCPSCHRAIHLYYSTWLKEQGKKDFSSKHEAHKVYDEAVQRITK